MPRVRFFKITGFGMSATLSSAASAVIIPFSSYVILRSLRIKEASKVKGLRETWT